MADTWIASLQSLGAAAASSSIISGLAAAGARTGENGGDRKWKIAGPLSGGSGLGNSANSSASVSLYVGRANASPNSDRLRCSASCPPALSWSHVAEDTGPEMDVAACSSSVASSPSSSPSFSSSPYSPLRVNLASSMKSHVAAASAVISRPGFGGGGGAGLLERPDLNLDQGGRSPDTEEGGDLGKLPQKRRHGGGDRYRLLLLDHERHTELQVAKVLPTVVPSVTPDEARRCFRESRQLGFAVVLVCVKEHAEFYAQMMLRNGLRSSIEPDGSVL